MKKSITFSQFQLTIFKKHQKLILRLRSAIQSGNITRYSSYKKRQILNCLTRYERKLRQCGIALVTGTALLLPVFGAQAQTPIPVGSEFRVNTYTTSAQVNSSVAIDSDGDFVISWFDFFQDGSSNGIYAQRFDNTGTAQGAEFLINTYTTSSQIFPSVAIDSDGDFVVVWQSKGQDGSDYGIYAQRYDNAGVAQGSEFKVNTFTITEQVIPSVAMDSNGDFVISWTTNNQDGNSYGIYAQRYDNTGTAQGTEFQVNTYTTSTQKNSSVAMDSDGDFVICWQSIQDGGVYGIYAQRYDNTGVAQGTEFNVNTFTTNNQLIPSVAMNSNGDFVISWTSNGQDGGGHGIYAQRYDNTGAAQGAEFQVNTFTTYDQKNSSIAMDDNGDFVISWQKYEGSGNGYGIYAQRYDNVGLALGSKFQVNTYTTSTQTSPTIALDNNGNFVISWMSNGQDGSSYGIYAQRYMFPAPLPIELLFFTGHQEFAVNILEWATASEKNSAWQIIERSANGVDDWTDVGRVTGAGTSTSLVSYKISDDNPLPLGYYRLKSIDFDGSEQLSEVISISRVATELSILNVFPVPVKKEASILVNIPAFGVVNVSVHNAMGQLVFQNNADLTKGMNEIKINLSDQPAGNYAVTIEDGISRVVQQVVKR